MERTQPKHSENHDFSLGLVGMGYKMGDKRWILVKAKIPDLHYPTLTHSFKGSPKKLSMLRANPTKPNPPPEKINHSVPHLSAVSST
ncbi:hypothetical protein AM228_04480 [Planktothricoides sp. SR001]|nr:hypothetical protein AM228_04480 [Planktothricoides sp. SR001]